MGMAASGGAAKNPVDKMEEEGKLSPALELDWELVNAADAEPPASESGTSPCSALLSPLPSPS